MVASLTTTMVTERGTVPGGLIHNLQLKCTVIIIIKSLIYVKHNVQAMATKECFHGRKKPTYSKCNICNRLDPQLHNQSKNLLNIKIILITRRLGLLGGQFLAPERASPKPPLFVFWPNKPFLMNHCVSSPL